MGPLSWYRGFDPCKDILVEVQGFQFFQDKKDNTVGCKGNIDLKGLASRKDSENSCHCSQLPLSPRQ